MRKLRVITLTGVLWLCIFANAQVTSPVNGVSDPRTNCYAFTNATLVIEGFCNDDVNPLGPVQE